MTGPFSLRARDLRRLAGEGTPMTRDDEGRPAGDVRRIWWRRPDPRRELGRSSVLLTTAGDMLRMRKSARREKEKEEREREEELFNFG